MAKPDDMIDAIAAGKILGVSSRQVRHLISQGIIPATKFGNSHVIRRSDLAKVPKDRKPGPKTGKAGKKPK